MSPLPVLGYSAPCLVQGVAVPLRDITVLWGVAPSLCCRLPFCRFVPLSGYLDFGLFGPGMVWLGPIAFALGLFSMDRDLVHATHP